MNWISTFSSSTANAGPSREGSARGGRCIGAVVEVTLGRREPIGEPFADRRLDWREGYWLHFWRPATTEGACEILACCMCAVASSGVRTTVAPAPRP